jgi:uncharacterized membrane protein YphA (DoxX/SURF4 family)
MEITAPRQQNWTPIQKIAFRFFCCFFLLYIFPFPLDSFPFINEIISVGDKIAEWYAAPFQAYTNWWHLIIAWIGKNILALKTPITIFTNGSGDTTYDYVLLLTHFCLALLACTAWSLLDRRRKSYNQAYYWLRVVIRYYLGAVMLGYGFAKVFHLQMPFPYLSQLVQPFGDKSPMGLAWSFFGYSKGYSAFTGWVEVMGGFLLFFRRTALLGSVLVALVMLNVAAINYCFDVPVKLYSSMLFIMAVFLTAPDIKRLLCVFVYHKPVLPASFPTMLSSKKMRTARIVLKFLFIASVLYSNISGSLSAKKQYGDERKLPPLYGIYNSEFTVRNNDTLLPLVTDSTQWRQLIVQREGYAQVKLMNDSLRRYEFKVNDTTKTITTVLGSDTSKLSFKTDSSLLWLWGRIGKDSVYIRMRRYDVQKFRLVNRGFNWINEYPYNR